MDRKRKTRSVTGRISNDVIGKSQSITDPAVEDLELQADSQLNGRENSKTRSTLHEERTYIKPMLSPDVNLPEDFLNQHIAPFREGCKRILRQDPSLRPLILMREFPLFLKTHDDSVSQTVDLQYCFGKLGGAIIAQQLSGKAANSIKGRLLAQYDNEFPTYKDLQSDLADPAKRVRIHSAGFSQRKMEYMDSLCTYFVNNEARLRILFGEDGTDEEIVNDLVKEVKGIGPWSAKMFLVTALRRMNVFAPEDLGLARGTSNYLKDRPELVAELLAARGPSVKKSKIKHKKLNWKIYDIDIMESCAERFQPFRTIWMFLLWRMSSTNIDALLKTESEFTES